MGVKILVHVVASCCRDWDELWSDGSCSGIPVHINSRYFDTSFSQTLFFFQSGGKARKALHVPYRDSVLTWLLKVKAESVPSYNESNLKKTIHH